MEMTLSVMPARSITKKVASSEKGMARAMTSEVRTERRKAKRTRKLRAMAISVVLARLPIDCSMKSAWL